MDILAHKLSATFNKLIARSSFGLDAVLRMPLAIFYGVLAFSVSRALVMFVLEWPTLDVPFKGLRFASLLANAVFLFTLLSLTVLRSKPVRSFTSLNARLLAVLGLALPLVLGVLPEPDLPPAVIVVSIITIGVGCGLAMYTALWLGRSFSIAPQARQLVVGGAYSIVRHPLYCARSSQCSAPCWAAFRRWRWRSSPSTGRCSCAASAMKSRYCAKRSRNMRNMRRRFPASSRVGDPPEPAREGRGEAQNFSTQGRSSISQLHVLRGW